MASLAVKGSALKAARSSYFICARSMSVRILYMYTYLCLALGFVDHIRLLEIKSESHFVYTVYTLQAG